MTRRVLALLLAVPLLATGCAKTENSGISADAAASAPVPGVTLPPGTLRELVPTPEDVPAGMVPVVLGSGPRTLQVVASYSGTGAAAAKAGQALSAHGFQDAYVGEYANQTTGQVLSVLVSRFATAAGAGADQKADQAASVGTAVALAPLGDASSATVQKIAGSVASELLVLRFQKGIYSWVIAYRAAPTADPQVAVGLAEKLLTRSLS